MTREEMPSADSCGNPFLDKHTEGLLPLLCGAEAVFNFSWEKDVLFSGSGADDETTAATIIPTRTLLSTAAHRRTTRSTTAAVVGGVDSVPPNRSATRLPPRFTPSPGIRQSSHHHLLRFHLNSFNRRLSMLERNTLDMKESVHNMGEQQSRLGSRLGELIAIQSAGEKKKKVVELEESYGDMDARLSRLEGRLEILIDGFTDLAQEMNKMKRTRHVSRSMQDKRALPSPTERPLASRAAAPESIPTPSLPANRPTAAPQRARKVKSASATATPAKVTSKSIVSTRSTLKFRTTLSKPKTTSMSAAKPQTKRPEGRRSAGTAEGVSQPNPKHRKQVTEAITKFQLEPPSHKARPSDPGRAGKKDSLPIKGNGRAKAFRSDAPVTKKVQEDRKVSEGISKSLSHKANSNQKEKKMEPNSKKLVLKNTRNNSAKNAAPSTKPTKATTVRKSKTTIKRVTAKKMSYTTAKRKSPKTKVAAAKGVTKKHPQKKEKKNTQSVVLELLRLLQGENKSAKQKDNPDGSLHVVLGRLAIPVKIIPDD
uniref:muscle M-line assembly protein unc-89-like n=1 Tax=Gasterosteus aculeatus aculeatus TaxID=481459 RepID=UPI001A9971DF|nr:muscle M-line assembly protein unc-89-like [Gasterosteus aculeatus aculeatus]